MLRLDSTMVLQAVLAGAVATTQPQATASFSDKTALGYFGGSQRTALNGATDVTIVAAPAASTIRDVDYLSILNRDTAPITLSIKYDIAGVDSLIITATIASLETIVYTHANGWEVMAVNGAVKTTLSGSAQIPVQFQDEGIALGSSGTVDTLNFTGPGIVATRAGSIVTANVPVLDSFRNKIIGGDFGTNPWQRGTSFPNAGSYTADRFQFSNATSAQLTISRDASVPTVAQAGRLVTNTWLGVVNVADAVVGATDTIVVQQNIEGYNFQPLAQRPMVLSFWHAHGKTGVYCAAFRNAGNDRSFVAEYTQVNTGVWEYTSIVIPPSPAAGTWDYTNGGGLNVTFTFMAGATFHTTPGVWQTGNFLATANQVNGADTIGNTFRLALVQLESGTVATPFESRSFQEELILCSRYTIRRQANGNNSLGINGHGFIVNAQQNFMDSFNVEMRAAPTFSVSAASDFNVVGNGSVTVPTNVSAAQLSKYGAFLIANATPFLAGVGCSLNANNANAWLEYSAEL